MNREKVKEIKKALEDNANYEHHNKLGYIDGYKCKTVAYADILTYINELESENERLNKALVDNLEAYKDGFNEGAGLKKGVDDKLKTENQQLKDRIDELEKENVKQLKQFAERLKEKMGVREYMGVKYKQGVFSENDIDQTLKEFIND